MGWPGTAFAGGGTAAGPCHADASWPGNHHWRSAFTGNHSAEGAAPVSAEVAAERLLLQEWLAQGAATRMALAGEGH
ncbi:hypothetical protein ACSZMC_00215 [Aeromonas jandaei]|uniref:hypothetical protein n=1 Tax=Aeromonas jandaei TaxID=650 RepID=UPI003EC565AF